MTSPADNTASTPVVSGAGTTSLVGHAEALQSVLVDLSTLTAAQLVALFQQYSSSPNFASLLKSAFPQIVMPFAHAASQVTAQWYNELDPASSFAATPTVNLPAEQIDKTLAWALNAPGDATPLQRLSGSASRMVFDASRDTVTSNAGQQRIKYARYASANACAFCRVLASRGPVYKSEDSAGAGRKFHDHDHCVIIAVPDGQTYTAPDYVAQWKKDYRAAWNAVPDGTPSKHVLPMVLAHMREHTDAH